MLKSLFRILPAVLMLAATSGFAATWYISPTGSDNNSGTTTNAPLATIMGAQNKASSGDIVYIMPGTYSVPDVISSIQSPYDIVNNITKSGITYEAMAGPRPVFNFSAINPTGARVVAFWVTAKNVTFQGFDVVAIQENITNVNNQSIGMAAWGCTSCTWNEVNVHDADCVGFYLEEVSKSNLWYRCDSYNNAGIDSFSYGNADGFGCHPAAGGTGNIIRECRSWNNSDDGYDCINAHESVTFDHCWSYKNGNNGGNGNGFKIGGFGSTDQNQIADPIPSHTAQFCLSAQNNGNAGFYANHQPAGPGIPTGWTNNTSYNNSGPDFDALQRTPPDYTTNAPETDANDISGTNLAMHFNLAYKGTITGDYGLTGSPLVTSNSWNENVTVSAADFLSTDATQMTNARAADGSLPVITFMHLTAGSDLVGLGCFIVPPAPTNLTATASNTQVTLNWTASTNATGYNVKRSTTSGSGYTNIASDVTTTNFTDTGLANATTYYYVISALNPGDESTNSVQVSATTASIGPPITAASASPNPASPGQIVAISATVTTNTHPIGTVTVDVSAIGGLTNQTLVSDGAGHYTNSLTVGLAIAVGVQTLTVNADDNLGDISSPYSFSLTIVPPTAKWDGGASDNNWSSGTNWVGDTAPESGWNLVFAGPTRLTPVMDSSYNIIALTFDNTAGAFTIGPTNSGTLTLNSGVTNNSANAQTLNVPVVLGAPITVDAASGDLVFGQAVNNGGNLIVLTDGGHNTTLGGAISGAGGLSVTGVGTVVLAGTNTFGGPTTINSGTLQLANSLALQNSTLNDNGGNVTFSGITAATLNGLSGTNAAQNLSLTNLASAAVALSVSNASLMASYGGNLSGSGSLILNGIGSGTLTLSNANYTGNTTVVSSNTLVITGGSFGSPGSTITVGTNNAAVSAATLTISNAGVTANNVNVGNVINSTGSSLNLLGTSTASFNNTTLGQTNTAGHITISTTASVNLGNYIGGRDSTATGSTTTGLIIQNGSVTATSVDIQGFGTRYANLNILGGSFTIGNTNSSGAFKIGDATNVIGGSLTMNGGTLTYLGADGLLLANGNTTNVAAALISGGTATLTGITLNKQNFVNTTTADTLTVSNGATLYLGGVGLVMNRPSPTVFASFGNGGATVGAIADWSSTAPITLAGTTAFQSADASSVAHNISLGGVLSGAGGLIKTGAGTLTLSGTNTYAGGTVISAGKLSVNGSLAAASAVTVASGGTLGGTGVINGPATVQSGGTLAPGNSVGTLTFSNSLTLAAGSTNIFEISKSPLTNDVAKISGALTNGGTLIVTNIGATALAAGDTFQLLKAASYNGAFANVILPATPAGLGWNTNNLNTNGTLSVVVTAQPVIGPVLISGNGFVFTGTGGVANGNYYLLSSTNLATPLANWTLLLTNQFDNNGNFNFTNPLDPNAPQNFYLLQLP